MKKMTELPKQHESYNNLQASISCRIDKCKAKYCLSCMVVIVFLMSSLYSNGARLQGNETRVLEAYELRISGKAEKAEELLNELLKNDSTDALAYFELARTKQHKFLGGTQFSSEEWNEVMHALQQAVRCAPDNEIYAFYYAYSCFFNAFISMMRQQPEVGENVAKTCDAFRDVLKLNPDCHQAQLYMVDMYIFLPAEMGGDKEKAGNIASELGKKDRLYGAMATARLLPDTSNFVLYWQSVGNEVGMKAQVLEELGRAYLLKSDTENGTKYFEEAMREDQSMDYLQMHLVRYHLLSTQQDPAAEAAHLEKAIELVNSYMQKNPTLVPPLKAYAYGTLAMIKMIGGDNIAGNEYQDKATAIDPYYSKAMGMPPAMLYCRPDEVKIQYSSFFMPF
jgi:tetratricopeptide (TPR) repeat protein